eukprot:m.81249 g.81249  ORF g.81249 m.81249 type:complete len:415 (+) comp19447_c0_seq4:412-1656(+)
MAALEENASEALDWDPADVQSESAPWVNGPPLTTGDDGASRPVSITAVDKAHAAARSTTPRTRRPRPGFLRRSAAKLGSGLRDVTDVTDDRPRSPETSTGQRAAGLGESGLPVVATETADVVAADSIPHPNAVLSGHVVTLHRDDIGGFGLTLEMHKIGARVEELRKGSPSAESGALCPGDYIVQINGTSIQSAQFERVQSLLKDSKGPASVVVVSADAVDSMIRDVTLVPTSVGVGIDIFGEPGAHPRIRHVISGGPAETIGTVQVGDHILQVNGHRTASMSLEELRVVLRGTEAVQLLLQMDRSPLYPFLIDRTATQVTVQISRAAPLPFECSDRRTESGVFITKVLSGADARIREGCVLPIYPLIWERFLREVGPDTNVYSAGPDPRAHGMVSVVLTVIFVLQVQTRRGQW